MAIVRFKFLADASDVEKEGKKAEKALADVKKEFRDGVSSAAKWGAAVTAAGVAIATYLTKEAGAAAQELKNLANVSDTSLSSFQRMAVGAKEFGIEQDKLADILKDTKDRVGDFISTGAGPMVDFFENIGQKVGVTAEDFAHLGGPEALGLYVSSLEKAGASQAEMTFYMEAMAGDAALLLPLLQDNAAAMTALGDAAEASGRILSDMEIEQLAQMNKAVNDAAGEFDVLISKISAEFAPVITAIIDKIGESADAVGGFGSVAETVFDNVVNAGLFVADAGEGIKRTFEIAGDVIAGSVGAALVSLTFPLKIIMDGLEAIAELTGMDLPESVQAVTDAIQDFHKTNAGVVKESIKNIQDTLNEPMPSEGLRQFIDDAKAAGEEAAAAAIKAQEAAKAAAGTGTGVTNEKDQAEIDQLNTKLDAIREANMTEVELERQKMADKLAVIKEGLATEQITRQEAAALAEESWALHNENITEIERKAAEAQARVEEEAMMSRQQATREMFSNLRGLMSGESRKMFEIGKAAAIAETAVNTYKSATGAYSALASIPIVGPALGVAAAAAAVASGNAQIQSIRSQQFGSASGSATTAGASGGGAAAGAAGAAPQAADSRDTFVTLQGIDPSSFVQAGGLVSALNQEIEDGATIRAVRFA